MKIVMIIAAIVLFSVSAFAQDETLINEEFTSGGFGGPEVRIGSAAGATGVFIGGKGGWLINHTFVIGGAGYGLVNDVKVKDIMIGGEQAYLNFAYGGLHLEYIENANKLVHYSVQVLVGGGGVQYRREMGSVEGDNSDAVFVLEPSIAGELNVSRFFRVCVGAGYRFVNGVQSLGLTNNDLCGASGFLTLKFGTF